jgi:hypothetical protein
MGCEERGQEQTSSRRVLVGFPSANLESFEEHVSPISPRLSTLLQYE